MLTFVALFLPLFPLSALLNLLLARLRPSFARSVLLLLWPQLGVTLLHWLQPEIPAFFVTCAAERCVLCAAPAYGARPRTMGRPARQFRARADLGAGHPGRRYDGASAVCVLVQPAGSPADPA